jgi:RimJ/RimL family protein N-acetyltransferase
MPWVSRILSHCTAGTYRSFERLNCIAVEFRTHFFNMQSRAAIERSGAKLDGILRQHQIASNGTLRDTCVYSILDREWPTVRAHLTHQLGPS